MLSLETERRLAKLLMGTAELEKQVEVVRQVLAEQALFEPYAVFQRLDRQSKGYLSPKDLMNFLRSNKKESQAKPCFFLIKFFDSDMDGKLSYTDFLEMVLPTCAPDLRSLACQRPNYRIAKDEFLDYDVEYALLRVLEREFSMHSQLEKLRQSLCTRFDFSCQTCFRAIDKRHERYLNYDNLTMFLTKNGMKTEPSDILALIRRIDKKGNGVLTYMEFMEAVMPLAPNTKRLPSYCTPTKNFNSKVSGTVKGKTGHVVQPRSNINKVSSTQSLRKAYTQNKLGTISHMKKINANKGIKKKRTIGAKSLKISPIGKNILGRSPSRSKGDLEGRPKSAKRPISSSQPIQGEDEEDLLEEEEEGEGIIGNIENLENLENLENIEEGISDTPSDIPSDIRSGSQRECNINNKKRESNINEKRGTTFDRSSGSLSKSPPNQRRTKKRSSSAKREKPRIILSSTTNPSNRASREGSLQINGNLGHEGSEGSFRGGNGNLGGKLGEEKCLEELINAMKEQIKLETELESMRQDMSLLVDFDIHNAFHYFDKEGKGYLNTNDINVVLEDLSITPLQDDILLFIRRYDPNLDSKITYQI